jgi:ArsR family transcriptional regulator
MSERPIEACSFLCVHEDVVTQVRQHLPEEESLLHLADLFQVFGDGTRVRILFVLLEAEVCVCDLATLLGMTQSAVSHQLRILKQAQLIKARRDGKIVYYSLADDHVATLLKQGMEHVCE